MSDSHQDGSTTQGTTLGTTMIPGHADQNRIQNHHTQEWSSGARGGGKVPDDFGWHTNPKQWQEELGSAALPGTPQASSK